MRELTRLEVLEWLLLTFNDAREPLRTGGGDGSKGSPFDSKLLRMPRSWRQGSYEKLERGLQDLRRDNPVYYWHVSERYIRKTTKLDTIIVERPTPKGVYREVRRVTVDVQHPNVDLKKTSEGVSRLSQLIPGQLWLPKEVLEVAAA